VTPPVWRRVLVPAGYTLDRLHRVIQYAMGWQQCHLHCFDIDGLQYGEPDPDSELAVRDEQRRRTKEAAAREIGPLSDRDLFLAGVALYWAEGAKDKPYDRRENVLFVNSDPGVIKLYLAWLDLLGVEPERLRYRVMIHMTADVEGAKRYWADLVGVDVSVFQKTTIKKHNPATVRKNVGATYRGCLVIRVSQGADLYRRIEGWWTGMVSGITTPPSSGKV